MMIRFVAISAITLSMLALSPARAADLVVGEAAAGAETAPRFWDGFYAGVHGSYGWGDADHINAVNNDLELSGLLAGVQAGVALHIADSVVAGIEADLAMTGMSASEVFPAIGETTHNIDWLGSIRARVGLDGGTLLPYLTAGLAVAGASRKAEFPLGPGTEASATHVGWTAGAGVEVAATEDMSIDVSYRYSDLGEAEYEFGAVPNVALTTHTVRGALNWHF